GLHEAATGMPALREGEARRWRQAAGRKEQWLMVEMRYRVLGASGIKVSEICLGTMMFGGPTDGREAQGIIDHAAEKGVNFIDTANVYAEGRSESVIGSAIRANRERWVLATKVAQQIHGSRPVATSSRARRRSKLQAAAHRPHRHLLHPPRRPQHSVGRND